MKVRMEYWKAAPGAFKAMSSLETYLRDSGLDHGLMHMVKLRASQINGCAYCIDMHWKDARAAGQNEQRLYGLDEDHTRVAGQRMLAARRFVERGVRFVQVFPGAYSVWVYPDDRVPGGVLTNPVKINSCHIGESEIPALPPPAP